MSKTVMLLGWEDAPNVECYWWFVGKPTDAIPSFGATELASHYPFVVYALEEVVRGEDGLNIAHAPKMLGGPWAIFVGDAHPPKSVRITVDFMCGDWRPTDLSYVPIAKWEQAIRNRLEETDVPDLAEAIAAFQNAKCWPRTFSWRSHFNHFLWRVRAVPVVPSFPLKAGRRWRIRVSGKRVVREEVGA